MLREAGKADGRSSATCGTSGPEDSPDDPSVRHRALSAGEKSALPRLLEAR